MRDVARHTRDILYTLNGVRKIQILGVQEERVYLEATPSKLAEFGVSPQQIFGALEEQNIIQPGGQTVAGGRTVLLEPSGNLSSVAEIGAVVFRIPDTDRVLRLDEVVTIRRGYADPPILPSFYNDRPAIILAVSTVTGTNNVDFGRRLTAMLKEIEQDLPIGYVFDYATFQPDLIEESVSNAVSNVYQTLAIVLAVVMLFLGVRTGLIVGSFVPLTMLVGIIIMRFYGVELKRMSIAAMIIALGLLVDNGIVVAKDIRVRLERGTEKMKAAADFARSLAIPLLTSSLTTILLLASWFLSMTVTPAMCVWFMKVTPRVGDSSSPSASPRSSDPSYDGAVYVVYRRVLGLMLRWRLIMIGGFAGLLVLAVFVLGTVRSEFFPLGDRNQLLIYLDYEAGIDIRETQRDLRKLAAWLADKKENPEIASHVAYVGYGGPRFFLAMSPVDPDPQRGFALINTRSVDDVEAVLNRVNTFLDNTLPAARADSKRMWFGSTEPGVVQIRIIGPDGDVLTGAAEKIIQAFHDVPGTVGIKQYWENKILKLIVDVDQTRASRAGVSSEDVARSLNATFEGVEISDYREGDKTIPIIVRGTESLRFSLSGLQRVQVQSSTLDKFISLAQVATVRPEWRFSRIERRNQQRTIIVEARNPGLSAPALHTTIKSALVKLDLPVGHRWELGGEIADQSEANENLFGLLPPAFAGIVVLLVGQFNSFRKGGIIVATIPLILIGGTIGLAGILINNGIVLIDRIQTELAGGSRLMPSSWPACPSATDHDDDVDHRSRPGAAHPVRQRAFLRHGERHCLWLVLATVLTLGFVPVVYTLLFGISTRDAGAAMAPPSPE